MNEKTIKEIQVTISEDGRRMTLLRPIPGEPGVMKNELYEITDDPTDDDVTLIVTAQSGRLFDQKRLALDISQIEKSPRRLLKKEETVTEKANVPATNTALWIFAENLSDTKHPCYLIPIGPSQVLGVN